MASRWLALTALGLTLLLGLALSWGALRAWAEGVPVGEPPAGQVVAAGNLTGTIGGAVSVGELGAASWTTVLKVVSGVGGLQPSVSLGYGGSGYGGVGVGFSLSAGGAVSRCRPTLGQDGHHAPLTWTQADPLCLDGARLVAVQGEYGASDTEYGVQTAPLVRVVGLGKSTDTHSGFVVFTPDGRQTLYGVMPPLAWTHESMQWARIGTALVPFSWHITRVIDTQTHNQMRYRYTGEPVEGDRVMTPEDHRLARIEYGINPTGGTDATRQVLFEYTRLEEVRSDLQPWDPPAWEWIGGPPDPYPWQPNPNEPAPWVHQGYVAGMAYTRWRLLTRVEMQVRAQDAWQAVRQYRLAYEPVPDADDQDASSADRARLEALYECLPTVIDTDPTNGGHDPTPCLDPTHFEWSQAPKTLQGLPGFGFDGAPFYPLPPASELKTAQYDRVAMQVVGDFDGDGDEDFLVMPETMNTDVVAHPTWALWRTDPDVHAAVESTLATWSTQPWTNRAGTVVPAQGAIQIFNTDGNSFFLQPRPPEKVQTGHRRDEKAAPGAWAVNYDGSGGTDVLLGEPVLELAGALGDTPWGVGAKTAPRRQFASAANNAADSKCAGAALWEGAIWHEAFSACAQDLDQSKADYTGHPGFMRDLKIARLRPASAGEPTASFSETSLQYPDGRPILWAQPLDLDGDALTDLMFCKADADYAAVAGQALPMFYGSDPAFNPVNWVSGEMYYALNSASDGIDLSNGGTRAKEQGASGQAIPCHAKDSYLVMDLDGDGGQSLLHYTHRHAKQIAINSIAPGVPAGVVDDPYPADPQNKQLTAYLPKLTQYVWAQKILGEAVYSAFTYRTDTGMGYGTTGLPYEFFMRWQRQGNTVARYSTHQASSPVDADGGMASQPWATRDGRLTDWGSPGSLMVGGGPSELRSNGDINGDGLSDVLMVDLASCYYPTQQGSDPVYKAEGCSWRSVAEFGQSLIEQTYEKLVVKVYLSRGDGTFALADQHRLWDTDLEPAELQALTQNDQQNPHYNSAWVKATAATRGWRMEFASSLIGDGNGDGLADLGYLRMDFTPNGGWTGDSMAGQYTMTPVWRLGRHGGGLSENATPMGLEIDKLVPASQWTGWPGFAQDQHANDTFWGEANDSPATLGPYAQQEYGLAARLMQLDVDHDGRAELVFYDHVRSQWRLATPETTDEPQGNLLVAVTDGLGARSEVDYAAQWTLTLPSQPWTQADLDLPYPLLRRPSTAAAVAQLRTDTGQDAGNAPLYAVTQYLYGKSTVDVRHGASLGIERSYSKRTTPTPSGTVNQVQLTRYDTAPHYSGTMKAYPLAGSVLSQVAMVWGEPGSAVTLSHSGQRYSAHVGAKPGTWRRQLESSTATTYEVGSDVPANAAGDLFTCLGGAYDPTQDCALGAADSYQPLSHSTTTLGYDATYGLMLNQSVVAAGSTTLSERTLEHHDPAELGGNNPGGYVLGLPVVEWTAHEPKAGVGYTVRTVVNDYFPNGQLQATTVEPDQPQYRVKEAYTYGAFGHVKTKTITAAGTPDNVTTYDYTPSGAYLAQTTNALGHTATTRWFEGCGMPEQQSDAQGHTVVNDIDGLCRQRGTQTYFGAQALDRKTKLTYQEWEPDANEAYADREPWVITQVQGGPKRHTIANRIGQVLVSQGPGFGFEVYTQTRYDALGRPYQTSLPTPVGKQPAGWTTTTYDAQGRAVQLLKPDGSEQTTQYQRYETIATNELGHSGRSRVNALGQVVQVSPPQDLDPNGPDLSMCYAYGAFGTLVQAAPCVANPNKGPTTLTYDDYGRLVRSEDGQAGVRLTRYTPLGQVDESEDAQGTITKQRYDVLGRLVTRIQAYNTPQAKIALWAYDTVVPGVLAKATNADNTVTEVPLLDEVNRVVGSTTTIHGHPYTQRQQYDGWGRVVGHSYPSLSLLAPVQTWTQYNDADQAIGLSLGTTTLWQPVQADAWGHLTEQRFGNVLTATASYGPLTGRLDQAQVSRDGHGLLEHFSYAWRKDGLIERRTQEALTQTTNDQVDQLYYTPRGELEGWTTIGANNAVQQHNMTTDGFGNITDSPTGHYTYAQEKLQKIEGPLGTLSYAYDSNGNVIQRTHQGGTTTLIYDAMDRVSQIKDPQSELTITYNAGGAKVRVRDAKTGRETYYLGAYQEERGGSLGSQIIGRYALGPAHLTRIWGKDLSYKDTLRYTPPADHLGSTTLVTTDTGAVAERRSYGVWGNERNPNDWLTFQAAPKDDLTKPNSGYTGTHERRQRGATAPGISGIVDMQARYYDPAAMQFMQPDTIIPNVFDPLSWNRRTYVNNSPVAFTDPTGHGAVNADGSTVIDGAEQVARNQEDLANFSASRVYGHNGPFGGGATGIVAADLMLGMRAAIARTRQLHEQQVQNAHDEEQKRVGAVLEKKYRMALLQHQALGEEPPFANFQEFVDWYYDDPANIANRGQGEWMTRTATEITDTVTGAGRGKSGGYGIKSGAGSGRGVVGRLIDAWRARRQVDLSKAKISVKYRYSDQRGHHGDILANGKKIGAIEGDNQTLRVTLDAKHATPENVAHAWKELKPEKGEALGDISMDVVTTSKTQRDQIAAAL